MLAVRESQKISGRRRWAAPAALALASVALPKPARAEQFVVVDETYTATAQNTDDSHYRVRPRAGTPSNWRSPIDFASGRAHARLEVLEKPSTRKTLYNICYEATPSYACMAYSPAYTAPGVYDWEGLAFGDYLIGGEMPAEMGSMLVTDSSGMALQNPVLQLGEMAPQVEYRIFYFAAAATPTA